jgi:hypothetical protein
LLVCPAARGFQQAMLEEGVSLAFSVRLYFSATMKKPLDGPQA